MAELVIRAPHKRSMYVEKYEQYLVVGGMIVGHWWIDKYACVHTFDMRRSHDWRPFWEQT